MTWIFCPSSSLITSLHESGSQLLFFLFYGLATHIYLTLRIVLTAHIFLTSQIGLTAYIFLHHGMAHESLSIFSLLHELGSHPIFPCYLPHLSSWIIWAIEPRSRGVIGEVRYGFLRIYVLTPYSAVFLLHAPVPAPIKIGFGAVQFGLVRCSIGAVLQFGLNSFGSDWTSPNVNFNLKNPSLQQLKNLVNYSIQI